MADQDELEVILSLKDQLTKQMAAPQKTLDSLKAQVEGIARSFRQAGTVITGAVAIMARSALQTADQLDKMNRQTGVSVETLQKLSFVAAESGASLQDIGTGMRFLGRNLEAARTGSQEAIRSFGLLGISIRELEDPSTTTESLFYRIADAMKDLSDEDRQQVFHLLGRGAAELIPLLSQGSDAIKALGEAAKSTGAIMSTEAVQALDSFGDQLDGLGKAAKGMFGELLASQAISLPKILEGLEIFANTVFETKERFIQGWKSIISYGQAAAATLKDIFMTLVDTVTIAIAKAVDAIRSPLEMVLNALNKLGAVSNETIAGFKGALDGIGDLAKQNISDPMSQLPAMIGKEWKKASDEVMNYEKEANQAIKDAGVDFATLRQKFQTAADLNTGPGRQKIAQQAGMNRGPGTNAMLDDLIRTGEAAETMFRARNQKIIEEIQKFEHQTGIQVTAEQFEALAKAAKNGEEAVRELFDEIKTQAESDPLEGLKLALYDVQKSVVNMRKGFGELFQSMEGAFSNALQSMMSGGTRFRDVLKNLFSDIKRAFIKMIADILAQQIMKQFASLIMGGLGIGGGGGPATMAAGGGGGGGGGGMDLSSGVGAGIGALGAGALVVGGSFLGGGSAAGGESALGGINTTALGLAGGMIGAGITQQQVAKGNMTGSILGGAATGASFGMILGPIGAGVGAVVGAAAGAILGNMEKKKLEKQKKAAEKKAAEQAAALEAQKQKAADLLKTQLQTTFGGGLATPEEAAAIGEIMSGDVTPEDLDKLGVNPSDIMARQQEIQGMAQVNNVNVGSPNINVSIGSVASAYDIKNVADDLGYFLKQSINDAAGSNG